MKTILLIDDDIKLTESIELNVGEDRYSWIIAHDGEEGISKLFDSQPDLIICDIRMPKIDGLTFLETIREKGCDLPVIMITAYDDMQTTIRAMQLGAFEYICKPIDTSELELNIERALATANRERKLHRLVNEISAQYKMNNIIGFTPAMKEIFKTIGQVTNSRVSVMILGESGTGKELIAKAIHYNSDICDSPFTPVNCSAIPEGLFESELFGHEKGSFTGAIATTKGKCEVCADGTLFLDEIGDVPLAMQAKLLRVLQEREFYRVGGSKRLPFNARVIAATHRDLDKMVEEGTFREDLYYRLSVVPIKVPPLRDRMQDIPSLVEYLIDKINGDLGANIRRIDPETLNALKNYDFPGNVRELENILRHSVVMAKSEILLPEYIPNLSGKKVHDKVDQESLFSFPDDIVPLEEMEKRYIIHALERTGWKKKQTCEYLKIARTTLDRKLEQYGIKSAKKAE